MNQKALLCVFLAVPAAPQALALAKKLKGTVGLFKIGLELFACEGPSIVRAMRRLRLKVFLDLKFHDIPNTAAGAARAVIRLGVASLNIHAARRQETL